MKPSVHFALRAESTLLAHIQPEDRGFSAIPIVIRPVYSCVYKQTLGQAEL